MATTTNFGWETPDDTDLVKDGAAAMRTLGGAIDTSLVDLKGGTTGQILSKASNTDMDFTWINSGSSFIGVSATKSAAQSINNATSTILSFDVEQFDTNTFHDNTTNNSRFTIPSGQGGKYLILGQVFFASNSTGLRQVNILVNGTTSYDCNVNAVSSAASMIYVDKILDLVATDYVQLQAYQTSGGALNIQHGTDKTAFQMIKVG